MISRQFRRMFRVLILAALLFCAAPVNSVAQSRERPIRIAVLDFGNSSTGRRVADKLAENLVSVARRRNDNPQAAEFQILDRDQSRAAALGAGYRGSLNMTLQEARDLGSTIGCDFFFAGEAQTVRRSPSEGPFTMQTQTIAQSSPPALGVARSARASVSIGEREIGRAHV